MAEIAFLGAEENAVERVFSEGRKEQVRMFGSCVPETIGRHNVSYWREELYSVKYAFSTWGMPNFTQEEIKKFFPSLKYVFYAAGTVKNFAANLFACGVRIFSSKRSNAIPVAETVFAQIVLANKGFFRASEKMPYAEKKKVFEKYAGNYGATVGLIGVGTIGALVAEKLKDLSVNVIAWDKYLSEERASALGISLVTLEEVFIRSDVISNHLADKPETEGTGKKLIEKTENGIDEIFKFNALKGQKYSFFKRCAYFTTHDDIDVAVLPNTSEERIIEEHVSAWQKAWETSDVSIEGDDEIQLGVRWNIFNLMQLAYEGNTDISISATGLHGQGYFGHAFWDTEIFMVPFYLATDPEEAKSLLLYRYKRLAQAKEIAKNEGCEGAKFPWTSAYTGRDVTPPDWAESSKREIHIAGAVAYAMHNYYRQTDDYEFYKNYAIETIVETAKYYMSRTTLGEDGKYHIEDVTGPDEYNIHVTDNYYTNYLAKWNMLEAIRSMEA